MIKLKNILLSEAPSVSAAFGKWAFTGKPKKDSPYNLANKVSDEDAKRIYDRLKDYQQGEEEPNTTTEEKILRLLSSWTDESDEMTADLLYSKFPLFKEAKSVFPRIFATGIPNGTPVFRGLKHAPDSIRAMLDPVIVSKKTKRSDWKKSLVSGAENVMFYSKPLTYKPHLKIQSWSTDSALAHDFTGMYSILLCTRLDNDNFVFNPNTLNTIFRLGHTWGSEMETIHFGKRYKNDVFMCMKKTAFDHYDAVGQIKFEPE